MKNLPSILYSQEINHKKKTYNIHQWILDTKGKNIIIDHFNMNRFDNRKENLRIADCSVNGINQIYKGYNFDKQTGKYLVRIKCNGKDVNLGRYCSELEAEQIYLKATILIGTSKISSHIQKRIDDLNILLSEEDLENKYIKKLTLIMNDEDVSSHRELNGKINIAYDSNIELFRQLREEGYSYHKIAIYCQEHIKGLERAKGSLIKDRLQAIL